jgi:hypothetical protein
MRENNILAKQKQKATTNKLKKLNFSNHQKQLKNAIKKKKEKY